MNKKRIAVGMISVLILAVVVVGMNYNNGMFNNSVDLNQYSMRANTRGSSIFGCRLTTADLQEANALAKAWLYNNVRDKGLFVYSADARELTRPNRKNNELRQLLASRQLALDSSGDSRLAELHRKNLDFIMLNWYRPRPAPDNSAVLHGIIVFNGKSKLGANAMLLRALVASPRFQEYAATAKAVADGILALQNPDGSFMPWYVKPKYEYDHDRLMTFYSGEAILALLEYCERLQLGNEIIDLNLRDSSYYDAARRAAEYYLDRYVKHMADNYYPAYVPWHTMAYARLYALTHDTRYSAAVMALNDKLLELQDTTNYVGRFYNPATPQYGSPHVSSDAIYVEGLAHAYELAVAVGDTVHVTRYGDAINLGLRNLLSLQCTRPEPQWNGAICIRAEDEYIRTRVDATQHTIDALTKVLSLNPNDVLLGGVDATISRQPCAAMLGAADNSESDTDE